MGTTKLIVEFVIAGVVVLFSILFLGISIFPGSTADIIAATQTSSGWLSENWALLAVVVTSIAYGLGVVFEYLGLITFEWLLDIVKEKRMKSFIAANPIIVKKSPLLTSYQSSGKLNINRQQISAFYGDMRFFVMMMNSQLYAEIDAYINRFRLIRVLFLTEVITVMALLIQLANHYSVQIFALVVFMVALAWANYLAVQYQFSHYCRAVERSYKALLLDSSKAKRTKGILKDENE